MNVGESCDVNTVLRFFLDLPAQNRGTRPNAVEALGAAKRLADGANKCLLAGLRGKDVEQNFTRTRPMREALAKMRARAQEGAKA